MDLMWNFGLLYGLVFLGNATGLAESLFTQVKQFQDKLPAGFSATWERSSVHSASACALLCGLLNDACHGFFYNEGSKTCLMTSGQFVTQGNKTAAPGYRYYKMACPAGSWVHESSVCFKLYKQPTLNWMDARDTCVINGGRLAVLDTTSKLQFFMTHVKAEYPTGSYFVGGHRPYARWGTSYPGGVPDEVWLSNVPVNWTESKTLGYTLTTEPNNPTTESAVIIYNGGRLGNSPASCSPWVFL